MKAIALVLGLLILVGLGGCVSMQPQQVLSAAGEPPGYYAGLEQHIWIYQDWESWYRAHLPAIQDIKTKIAEIKAGQLTPGCIGRDLHTCVATLSQTLAVADYYGVSQLHSKDKVDVNGNVMFEHMIMLTGFIPKPDKKPDYDSFARGVKYDIRLGDDRKVTKVMASLIADPFFAKTQEDYDKTGVYEVIQAMTLTTCPNISRIEVYRFIENKVKPSAKFQGDETKITHTDIISGSTNQATGVEFCGQMIDFYSVYGNSTDSVTLRNPHGAFGGMTMAFVGNGNATPQSRPVKQNKPPKFGVTFMPLDDKMAKILKMGEPRGVFVVSVDEDSIAKQVGIRKGDVILKYGDKVIMTSVDLQQAIADSPPGVIIPIKVYRYGSEGDWGGEIIVEVTF